MIPGICQRVVGRVNGRFSPISSAGSFRSRACAAALLALLPVAGQADDMGLGLRYGEDGSDYRAAGVSFRFRPFWTNDIGNWRASLSPAAEFTRFRYRGDGDGPRSLSELGAIGMFRFARESGWIRPYAEAGLGVSLFSRQDLGNKIFSTAFQFSEHLGLGLCFAEHWSLGVRFSHYSNADIEIPNKGLDVQQVMLGFSF